MKDLVSARAAQGGMRLTGEGRENSLTLLATLSYYTVSHVTSLSF